MSEEEKEAINNLNFIIVTDVYDNEVKIDKTKIVNEYNESVGIVLNLISNLQKENEELENKIDTLIDEQEEREKYTHTLEGKILILQKELDKKDKVIDYLAEKLEEKSKSMTKGKWKIVAYNQVEKVGGEDE